MEAKEMKDLELLRKISEYNVQNSELEMQIAANHKEIAMLELQRKELRVFGDNNK